MRAALMLRHERVKLTQQFAETPEMALNRCFIDGPDTIRTWDLPLRSAKKGTFRNNEIAEQGQKRMVSICQNRPTAAAMAIRGES